MWNTPTFWHTPTIWGAPMQTHNSSVASASLGHPQILESSFVNHRLLNRATTRVEGNCITSSPISNNLRVGMVTPQRKPPQRLPMLAPQPAANSNLPTVTTEGITFVVYGHETSTHILVEKVARINNELLAQVLTTKKSPVHQDGIKFIRHAYNLMR